MDFINGLFPFWPRFSEQSWGRGIAVSRPGRRNWRAKWGWMRSRRWSAADKVWTKCGSWLLQFNAVGWKLESTKIYRIVIAAKLEEICPRMDFVRFLADFCSQKLECALIVTFTHSPALGGPAVGWEKCKSQEWRTHTKLGGSQGGTEQVMPMPSSYFPEGGQIIISELIKKTHSGIDNWFYA